MNDRSLTVHAALFHFFSQALDRIDELGIEGRHADACGAARAKAEELQKADKLNRDLDAAAKRRDAVALAALLATAATGEYAGVVSKSAVARGETAVAQVAAEEGIVAEVEAAQAAAGGNADADTLRPFMERLRSEARPRETSDHAQYFSIFIFSILLHV